MRLRLGRKLLFSMGSNSRLFVACYAGGRYEMQSGSKCKIFHSRNLAARFSA